MNKIEQQMVEILLVLKHTYGAVSVKAEFEAEGTRLEELLRLVDVGRSASLAITVKIGGCEAIRDLLEAKQIGCKYIVAPMVETPYAASKFLEAKDHVYSKDEEESTGFLFNLETITGYNNRQGLLDVTNVGRGLDGVVLGRHDFVLSMNLPVSAINSREVTDQVLEVSRLCREYNKDLVVGGGMSGESITGLKEIAKIRLDRFETRKIIFDAKTALETDIEKGLMEAVYFEYLWLVNKRHYYKNISEEDVKRIKHFESRLNITAQNSLY
jgi:2-keto-3-deoxy-L-rhamnonate aldolase RhmA